MIQSKTVVVDYGLGNLRSVAGAISEVGGQAEVTADLDVIEHAGRIILPGVGAFPVAAEHLEASGIATALVAAAGKGVPILGICLGMQLLFERGNEFGWSDGLGLIHGDVLPVFDGDETKELRGTHIGWRSLSFPPSTHAHPLFKGIAGDAYFYFVHSYSAINVREDNILATVPYGAKNLIAAASENSVMGVQFHPEKSGPSGLRVLENFISL